MDITTVCVVDRTEVLSGFWNFTYKDRPEHHSNDHQRKKGAEK